MPLSSMAKILCCPFELLWIFPLDPHLGTIHLLGWISRANLFFLLRLCPFYSFFPLEPLCIDRQEAMLSSEFPGTPEGPAVPTLAHGIISVHKQTHWRSTWAEFTGSAQAVDWTHASSRVR